MDTRNWTPQQQLAALMRLPWSVRVESEGSDRSLVARVVEIPDAIGRGNSVKEVAKHLWESLVASLERRLDQGELIPLPPASSLPWMAEPTPPAEVVELQIGQRIGPLIIRPKATAA